MRRSIDSVDALVVRDDAFAAKQYSEPPISKAPTLHRQFTKVLKDNRIVVRDQSSSVRSSIARCDDTGFALAKPDPFNYRLRSSSPLGRR